MSERARRRARVELALVREGEGLSVRRLAEELGVSRWTVRRDVAAVRGRWAVVAQAGTMDIDAERARLAAGLEVVAAMAWEHYLRLADEAPKSTATVGMLRTAMLALVKRSKLLGVEGTGGPREDEERGPSKIILKWEDDAPEW